MVAVLIQHRQESAIWGVVKRETTQCAQFSYDAAWLWKDMAVRQGPSLARQLCQLFSTLVQRDVFICFVFGVLSLEFQL